jgi:hypothetical protein
MAGPQVLSTLRRKRDDIEAAIATYESKLEEARRDLAAVAATIRLVELNGEARQFPAYADIGRLWKRGEMVAAWPGSLGQGRAARHARTGRARASHEGHGRRRQGAEASRGVSHCAGAQPRGEAWDHRERGEAQGR